MISEIAIVGVACILSQSSPQQPPAAIDRMKPNVQQSTILPDRLEQMIKEGNSDVANGRLNSQTIAMSPTSRCGD